MTTQESKPSPFKSGLLAFVLTFIFLLGLLTAQFIYKYKEDLFDKNLDSWILVKMCSMVMVTLSSLIFPISILVFSVVYFRKLFRNGETDINTQIRKAFLPLGAFCIASFLWTSFLVPNVFLHEMSLLYDIRMKAPNEPMTRTDINLFKGSRIGSNFIEFGRLTDSSYIKIDNIKKQTAYSILTIADSTEINELLQDSVAKELGFTKADFTHEEMRNDGHVADTEHKFRSSLHNILAVGKFQIEKEKLNILENNIKKSKMIGFPFMILISFFIGMFIGILNRQQKFLAILLAGIYFTVFPGLYFLMIWSEKLVKEQKVSPFQGQLYFLLILTAITLILYKYATTQLRTDKQEQPIT